MKSEDRKKVILDTLVKDYIDHGEAISSSSLVNKTGLDISSATIRNTLVSLEQEGFVKHLHTSSGRVPTDRGYRFYVNNLATDNLNTESLLYFERSLEDVSASIDKMLTYSAQILGLATDYTTIIITENTRNNVLKFIQLVLLNVHQVLLVIINTYGENFEEIIGVDEKILDQTILNNITEVLNKLLQGKQIDDLGNIFENNMEDVLKVFGSYEGILGRIYQALSKTNKKIKAGNVVVENAKKLMNFPEFQDFSILKNIHSVLEDENKIFKMFQESGVLRRDAVSTCIGSEHKFEELNSSSLIFSTVNMGGEKIANIGILGPTRMNYEKIISYMKSMAKVLCKKIEQLYT